MIAQGWLYAAAFAVGLGVGAWVADNALSAEHEQYKASVAKDSEDRALAVLMALQTAGSKVQAGEAAISKVREDNAKADLEIERLSRCLKSGGCGLRIAAKCPSVPSTTSSDSAGRDSTAGARLDPAAESDYLEFRRKYAEQLKVLRICKAYGETQKPSQ